MKRNEIIRKTGICDCGVLYDMTMTDEYQRLNSISGDIYAEFMDAIKDCPKIVELFEKFKLAEIDLQTEELEIYYSEGFRLGVLLGLDIANKDK